MVQGIRRGVFRRTDDHDLGSPCKQFDRVQ